MNEKNINISSAEGCNDKGIKNTIIKNAIDKIKQIFGKKTEVTPGVKNLGMLSAVEVMALVHAEEGLELFPMYLYRGTIKGNLLYKKDIPSMYRIVCLSRGSSSSILPQFYENKWYISDYEKKQLESLWYELLTEKIPAIFIIAPKESKDLSKNETITITKKDPIILIKHGENEYEPVHSRDNSAQLNAQLSQLN